MNNTLNVTVLSNIIFFPFEDTKNFEFDPTQIKFFITSNSFSIARLYTDIGNLNYSWCTYCIIIMSRYSILFHSVNRYASYIMILPVVSALKL